MLIHEILKTKYPIIQGGMTLISDGKFAASCSNAGILGLIGAGNWDKERVSKEIDIARSMTSNPFGVNIMMLSPHKDDIIDLVIEKNIPVVTLGARIDEKSIKRLKEANIMVFPVTSSVLIAKRLERYGIDGIIAEGMESGGHIGEATTLALVSQMVKTLNVPVIAAGGIASGKALNAMLALGAAGCQIGTILLASYECNIHDNFKEAIINARDNDTTIILKSYGNPIRVLKGPMTKKLLELEKNNDIEAIKKLGENPLEVGIFNGDTNNGVYTVGQIAGLIDKIKSIKEIIDDIIKEAIDEKEDLINKINSLK